MNRDVIPVSVIVPNFNSGFYLGECIASINCGQWPAEILIIDDCSTDGSRDLALKLQSQYANIRVLQRAANGGAAEARRSGISAALQEWIALVDADDLLEAGALADAYATITSTGADICIWNLWRFDATGKSRCDAANPEIFPKTGREAALLTLGRWGIHPLGISRRSIYEKSYHEFTETVFNADELLTRLVFSQATTVVGCEKRYFYRSNALSASQVLSVRRLSSLRSCFWLLDFARNYPEAPIHRIVRGGIGEARFYWANRKQIGSVETLSEVRAFVSKIIRFPGLWSWLWRYPKSFAALLFLSMATWVTQQRRREHGVD